MTEPLHTKYRPVSFDQVVGQNSVVASLQAVLKRKSSRAFLFCGDSGVGKTSLARICAKALGAESKDIIEIDAATYTGIDAMRVVQRTLQYVPLGKGTMRAIIVDEVHALSRQAWQSLLKSIEEPPPHVCWFFCTTEAGKVPATIKTRCAAYTLRLVPDDDLRHLLVRVCEAETINLPEGVGDLITREAHGSPRQMLVNLELCRHVNGRRMAAEVLRTALESDAVIELCRFLLSGGSWQKAMLIVDKLDGQSPESVRIVVTQYLGKVLKDAKGDEQACRLLGMLGAWAGPYNQSEGMSPVLLSVGRSLFPG